MFGHRLSPTRLRLVTLMLATLSPATAIAAPATLPPAYALVPPARAALDLPVMPVQYLTAYSVGPDCDCYVGPTPSVQPGPSLPAAPSVRPAPSDRRERQDRPGPSDLTTPNTTGIVLQIAAINLTCGPRVDARYKLDCLRMSYLELARAIPPAGDYLSVREALLTAADQLDHIITGNIDPAAPTIRPHAQGRDRAPRIPAVRAVAPARLAAANAAAADIIRETGLLILRSGEDPKRRSAHYREISAAVDTNLLLLRSV